MHTHSFSLQSIRLKVILASALLVLAACAPQPLVQTPASPLAAPDSPLAPAAAPALELVEGKGGLRGRIFSSITNNTVNQRAVNLPNFLCSEDAPPDDPQRTGCFWLFDTANGRTGLTDASGYFVFNDLEPGEYLLFVGDMTWDFAFYEDENERPITFVIRPGEVTELGNIILAFPY